VYYGGNLEIVKLSRQHNDANVFSIGARFATEIETKAAIDLWLATEFSGGEKYARRNKELDN
jgi:ribose 5-phosphate isomerase B